MATLTKTEQLLLDRAAEYGGRYSISTLYGRGPYGGRVSGGLRERNALFKLERAGLIEITDRQPWSDYNRGYCQSGNVIAYRLVKPTV